MSADLLREAASKMRERAEAATPGPWHNRRGPGEHVVAQHDAVATAISLRPREDRRHIASRHPAVALAVADWLDKEATWADLGAANSPDDEALTVARAYLGGDS